jgi:hypothetical protein
VTTDDDWSRVQVKAIWKAVYQEGAITYDMAENYFDCAKYLLEKGCPWNGEEIVDAIACMHPRGLIFLDQNECPWNEENVLETLEECGVDDTVDYVRKHMIKNREIKAPDWCRVYKH